MVIAIFVCVAVALALWFIWIKSPKATAKHPQNRSRLQVNQGMQTNIPPVKQSKYAAGRHSSLVLATLNHELDSERFPLDGYYMTLPHEKNNNTDVIKAKNMKNGRTYTFTETTKFRYEDDTKYCHIKGLDVEVSPAVFYFISQSLVFRREIIIGNSCRIINLVPEHHRKIEGIVGDIETKFRLASIKRS